MKKLWVLTDEDGVVYGVFNSKESAEEHVLEYMEDENIEDIFEITEVDYYNS